MAIHCLFDTIYLKFNQIFYVFSSLKLVLKLTIFPLALYCLITG